MRSTITRILANTFKEQHAATLLKLCQDHQEFAFRAEMLLKLARSRKIGESAISIILDEIHTRRASKSDLFMYVKLRDSRVKAAIHEFPQRSRD